MKQKPQCDVAGCEGAVRSRGYCALHYDRWLKSGKVSPGPVAPLKGVAAGKVCVVEGCGKPVRCKALCSSHYNASIRSAVCPNCEGRKDKSSSLCSSCHHLSFETPATHHTCTKCQETKPVEMFGWRTTTKGRSKLRSRCMECSNQEARDRDVALRHSNPEEHRRRRASARSTAKVRLDADPELRTMKSLLRSARSLRVDEDDVLAAWESTGNVCQSCGKKGTTEIRGRVVIDHCHRTGLFRGLLCGACNTAAGQLGDDPERTQRLADYLKIKSREV